MKTIVQFKNIPLCGAALCLALAGCAELKEVRDVSLFSYSAVLSEAQKAEIEEMRAKAHCNNPFPAPIALSAYGTWDHSSGQDSLLSYSSTMTNVGGAWYGNNSFIVPCDGYYVFSISFVKDSVNWNNACTWNGTQDDVSIYLTKNTQALSGSLTWSGQNSGERDSASNTVVLDLNEGDFIQSWLHSDGGKRRCVARYNLTAFRIADK